MAQDRIKRKRGLAALPAEKRREIASMGGKRSSGNFKNDPTRAKQLSSKGLKKRWQK